jgi:N-acetylmuramoyl-L-alanine amidase
MALLSPIRELSSPNFNARADGLQPTYLILHYTGTVSAQAAEEHYMNANPSHPGGPVSPHYMVDEQGMVTRFVPEDKRAWHAGVSRFDGLEDFNARSIGIEIVNPGHDNGYRPFPDAQMQAVIALCQDIMSRQPIPAANVLGHSDIAPARKPDPGELFDWVALAKEGIGLWPEPEAADYETSAGWLGNNQQLHRALETAGYDERIDTGTLVKAFQRHFHPERFGRTADAETMARLHCLGRMRLRI